MERMDKAIKFTTKSNVPHNHKDNTKRPEKYLYIQFSPV